MKIPSSKSPARTKLKRGHVDYDRRRTKIPGAELEDERATSNRKKKTREERGLNNHRHKTETRKPPDPNNTRINGRNRKRRWSEQIKPVLPV
ncbi:hypothetical protein Bca4012_010848 [Brassica carinata]|uniref:Uncharacterized protein n=1 Tax=Brassica carinata TaxID=52824 RepID=A0A8X7S4A1_BRACI|nr:hypothetical protein Bca52824_035748 [Brassica carinata]